MLSTHGYSTIQGCLQTEAYFYWLWSSLSQDVNMAELYSSSGKLNTCMDVETSTKPSCADWLVTL